MNIADIFQKGGPAMWPLLFLSILTIGTIFERLWFWLNLLRGERRFADQILEAARRDWDEAFWPHAKKGFFGLKKKMQSVLAELGLPV